MVTITCPYCITKTVNALQILDYFYQMQVAYTNDTPSAWNHDISCHFKKKTFHVRLSSALTRVHNIIYYNILFSHVEGSCVHK